MKMLKGRIAFSLTISEISVTELEILVSCALCTISEIQVTIWVCFDQHVCLANLKRALLSKLDEKMRLLYFHDIEPFLRINAALSFRIYGQPAPSQFWLHRRESLAGLN